MEQGKKDIDVIVIGELNVDIILNGIESFPVIGKEILADSMSVTLGSSSAIFASNLSSLGTKVSFLGKVGDDSFAQIVLDSLNSKNVDTSHIIKSSTLRTGATIVLNYDQERANITFPGAMNDLNINDIDFDFLSRARHMHFSSCFLQPGLRHDLSTLFRRSKESGLTTSLDAQWDPEEKWDLPLKEILPFVDLFLPNMKEFMFLTRRMSASEGIEKIRSFANYVVIKNGSEGALAWNGEEMIHQPAFINDSVIDCVGAGDSFNAGFIKDFINNEPLNKCLESGVLAGAVNTTMRGGTGAFINPENFRKIAQERFNYSY